GARISRQHEGAPDLVAHRAAKARRNVAPPSPHTPSTGFTRSPCPVSLNGEIASWIIWPSDRRLPLNLNSGMFRCFRARAHRRAQAQRVYDMMRVPASKPALLARPPAVAGLSHAEGMDGTEGRHRHYCANVEIAGPLARSRSDARAESGALPPREQASG